MLFPRVEGGPIPMLIIDGHQSRLGPKFIRYINDKGHTWIVCFGVPCATTLWQVGDASKQNGLFRVLWYNAKKEYVLWKNHNGSGTGMRNTDIIPLLNRTFSQGKCKFASV